MRDPRTARGGVPRALIAALIAAIIGCTFAACGSNNNDNGGGSTGSGASTAATGQAPAPTAAAPKGAPIKAWTIATLEAQSVPPFPNIGYTAKAYEKFINSKGGINGRPLAVTVCDDRGDPAQAGSCARDAVKDGAVAVVGSFTFFGDATVPVLQQAGTAWFGICCPQSASELSSPVSFPFGNPFYAAGNVARAAKDGCKSINAVIVQGAESTFEPGMKNAAKASGVKIGKFITLPSTAKDYSPQVAEATSNNADCVITIFGESLFKAWMPAWQQSGTSARMYGPQGNLNAVGIKGYEDAANGSVIGGNYPDLSTPAWADMRTAIANSPDADYNSSAGMGTWAAYNAFTKIVEKMSGTIDAKSFLAAANKTTDLDLGGQVPKLDLSKPWGDQAPKGFGRLYSCGVVFGKIEGGKVVADTTQFQNAAPLALGTGPLGPQGSPAACNSATGA